MSEMIQVKGGGLSHSYSGSPPKDRAEEAERIGGLYHKFLSLKTTHMQHIVMSSGAR